MARKPPDDAVPTPGAVPPAIRARKPTWREPRILIGIALICACVLIGARLMSSMDDTVGVFVVRSDLARGAAVGPEQLRVTQIRFADAQTADLYISAQDSIPGSATLNRDLKAGELLPRRAIQTNAQVDLTEVPISVETADLPATVRQGSTVDVWVTTRAAGAAPTDIRARLVLDQALVISVPRGSDSFAPQATRQIILGIPAEQTDDLAQALGALSDGRVVITRRS